MLSSRFDIFIELLNEYLKCICFRCLVSGWGKDAFTGTLQSIIKEVEVPIVPNNICQNLLRNTSRLGSTFVLNPTSFICAGGDVGRDACVVLYTIFLEQI